ncbi:MAG: YfcC family protein [Chloroflexia bacterium]
MATEVQAAEVVALPEERKRGLKFPTAYTILALLIIVVALLTFVIPAGRYNVDESGAPVPGTYHTVERNPQRIADVFLAPVSGMYGIQAADGNVGPYNEGALYGAINIALFILMIGGFIGVTMKTGAIDAGIATIVKRLGTNGKRLIPILMIVFAVGGTTYGMAEETLAFYPLIIAALIALGYDALTGVAVILLGAGIGTLASTTNPFATGIASGFAGTSIAEGIISRIVILILGTVVGIWWVMRYASKVKEDPTKSYIADRKEENEKIFLHTDQQTEAPEFTTQRKVILGLFGLAFLIMIVTVIPWSDLGVTRIATRGWYFAEFAALFLVFAIIIGFVGRLGEEGFVNTFIDGARDLLGVALVVGLARGITVVMNNGLITDTILNACEKALANLNAVPFINAIFLLYLPLAFLIPSSSGLATVTMPIMAPLAGFANVPESAIVTAYQSASGLLNLVTPTFAVVAGALAIGRISLAKWWRFSIPLVIMLGIIVMLVLSITVLIPH